MEQLKVSIKKRRQEASGIVSLELVDPRGSQLPAFAAGAHIDVHIAPGLVRQYSLYNAPDERHHYCIAVLDDPNGRGGSRRLHDALHQGDTVAISAPRNAFPLVEDGAYSVLLAGGIGITPLLSMAQRLSALGRAFELHYCARTRERAAFVDWLEECEFASGVHVHFDDEGETPFDVRELLASRRQEGAHLYLCGPNGFIDHVVDAARSCWPDDKVHLERFGAAQAQTDGNGAFQIKLARSGMLLDVPAEKTILDVLQRHGVPVQISCEQGVCGCCVVDVLDGEPEHRDSFLTDAEHRSNRQITVCCSRARSPVLTLDL
jgi:vanillate O-demethylase ferredoxin subunit